jgi:hypothetical protein
MASAAELQPYAATIVVVGLALLAMRVAPRLTGLVLLAHRAARFAADR